MVNCFVPSNIILRIIGFIKQRTYIRWDVPVIYTFFYKKSCEEKYKDILSKIDFDPSQQFPKSKTINLAFDRLIFLDLFIYPTGRDNVIEISSAIKQQNESLNKYFTKNDDKLLMELSHRLLKVIKVK